MILPLKSPNKYICLLVINLLLLSCKINQIKNKEQQGLWISYTDSTHTKFLNKGRFKKGIQVGKWIYNSPDGAKERIEVYRGTKMKIKHFHRNGKTAVKGKARIVVEDKKLHFFYYGPWYFYLENGKLEKTAWFENGIKV